jgi:seryl-tRNA synthetase
MLDLKFIRENSSLVKESLKNRNTDFNLDNILDLDQKRRALIKELDDLRHNHNKENKDIPKLKREGKDIKARLKELKGLSDKIALKEQDLRESEEKLNLLLLNIPNIVHDSVPVGPDALSNKVVREWGQSKEFDFKPLTHIEIGEKLDIIDFSRATKITGSNFILFKGLGAKLIRALMNFMLDLHTEKHGYNEVWTPLLVNRESMTATAQLPKLEDDMYKLEGEDYFLIPTAEVPVTNIHRDEILNEEDLPICYTAYTPCFRKEAGSYGKDTRGLVRVHQFDKVEMVKFTTPESSWQEHEKLTKDAEEVLQLLGLKYRVVALSSGDLSFAAAKCYDLEAWAPGLERWLEVSSCSNFTDFQARRGNIRLRRKDGSLTYVHTLNGSGLAFARVVICLLENYQQRDGLFVIPDILEAHIKM